MPEFYYFVKSIETRCVYLPAVFPTPTEKKNLFYIFCHLEDEEKAKRLNLPSYK